MMIRSRHDETIGWNIIDRAIIVGGVYNFCFLNNIFTTWMDQFTIQETINGTHKHRYTHTQESGIKNEQKTPI